MKRHKISPTNGPSIIAKFRKHKKRHSHFLCPEAELVWRDIVVFLNERLAYSPTNEILEKIEGVRIKILRETMHQNQITESHLCNNFEDLSRMVQELFLDLQTKMKLEDKYSGKYL